MVSEWVVTILDYILSHLMDKKKTKNDKYG